MSTNEPPVDPPAPPPPGGEYPSYGAPPPSAPYGGAPDAGGYGALPPSGGYGAPPTGPSGYSVGTAWSYGWSKFTANVGQILIAVLVLVGVQIVAQILGYIVDDALVLRWVFSLAAWVLSMIIGAGIVRAALDITEGKTVNAANILAPHKLGEVVIASLLTGVATFIGLILCVLPGLAVMFFTSFTLYFLMDREELGAIDAIRASFDFTWNNASNVIVWFLVSLATWFVGALLCGVGLIAAVPVVLIGTAYTYKKLTGQPVAP
ncbi:hypothetical protein [Nocardioides sp. W7]|uniref:hypothetical protein n=1 Tax=Nocardioides sp. W7 TaxID=2931390 RepID=UPI001FD1AE8E|nr:hypothetical protein [Nocardioides sp. W7]